MVVHKIDRLARNLEDHVAIRALLRRHGVALVSVTENIAETASGKLVEGIHALMAEFYSANLSAEIRKGLTQKAKMGGWPHAAPLGYTNIRESVGGRPVARIVPDPDRAPLITFCFERYATGEVTLQSLAEELAHRGLTNRGVKGKAPSSITWQGVARILANPAYAGVVAWNGAEHQGTHEPLVSTETFGRVQEILVTRSSRGTRERKHPHYLKGLLCCAVCGRRLSVQVSKKSYVYFFCLGQKHDPTGTCREPYTPADRIEDEVERLYERIQLPVSWVEQLREDLQAEVTERERATAGEREFLTRRLARVESQRRKLLDAYYAGALDVPLLKEEQERLRREADGVRDQLSSADAGLKEWAEILELAADLASRCGEAYRGASERTRKLFNQAFFERIEVRSGHVCRAVYRPPFEELLSMPGFEYGRQVEVGGRYSNRAVWEAIRDLRNLLRPRSAELSDRRSETPSWLSRP